MICPGVSRLPEDSNAIGKMYGRYICLPLGWAREPSDKKAKGREYTSCYYRNRLKAVAPGFDRTPMDQNSHGPKHRQALT